MDGETNMLDKIKDEPLDAVYFQDKLEVATQVLYREFTREIEEREDQVILIQEQIDAAQKCLEMLKYVVSCDYYMLKSEVKKEDDKIAIHPCVQKLLPNQLGAAAPPPRRPSLPPIPFLPLNTNKVEISTVKENKTSEKELVIERGIYKVNHHLVIGNVSKSISGSHREGEPTHKWMMYIRHKQDYDLSRIIKKVRYYLHESYKPDDIIDVKSAPFHLTRRGWGEFPLRVTIFFLHPSNKPIDLVHQLKLDHTLSGQQMLGGETLIQVKLYEDNIPEAITVATQSEPSQISVQPTTIDHVIANEHDYCSKAPPEDDVTAQPNGRPTVSTTGAYLDPHTQKSTELTIINNWQPSDGPIVNWYKNNLIQRASNITFFGTEACVKWLLKRWPIVTEDSSDEKYRIVHPYAFPSLHDFYRANIGRKRSAEWYRAWKIQQVVQALHLSSWTVKQIVMYSRMHGYVHFIGSRYSTPPSETYKDLSTFTSVVDRDNNLRQLLTCPTQHEEIDIMTTDETKPSYSPKKCKTVKIITGYIKFVETISSKLGIRLNDEELIDGVTINAPAAVLAMALKLFLDDLLRRSSCNAWLRTGGRCPEAIEVADVVRCILETPQFDILTNVGLGTSNDN